MTTLSGSITVSDNESEFSGLRVMVIDDSNTIRRTAETLLKKAGCEVLTADNGFEALPIISAHHPDIMFIDIMMPRLDGYQTCALVKNNPKFSEIPVVMLSSKDGLFDRAKGRVVGAEQYLTKPFTRDDLLGAIRTHLLNNKQDAD
jgi:twitching motility two-component system response regulator PilG